MILATCAKKDHPLAEKQVSFGPEGDFAGQTDRQTMGFRELDISAMGYGKSINNMIYASSLARSVDSAKFVPRLCLLQPDYI